jgi:hypothetical protein
LQRCRRHPGHGPLDQRARMGLRLRQRPAARRALHATAKSGFKSASGALLTGAISYQFNTGGPVCAGACGPAPTRASTKSSFLCCNSTAGHAGQRAGQRVVRVEGVGERVPVRLIEARPAPRCSNRWGWRSGGQRSAALRFAGLQPAPHLRLAAAAGVWQRRGHAQRRAQRGGKALCLQGARAVCRRVQLRARERPGRLPADPPCNWPSTPRCRASWPRPSA